MQRPCRYNSLYMLRGQCYRFAHASYNYIYSFVQCTCPIRFEIEYVTFSISNLIGCLRKMSLPASNIILLVFIASPASVIAISRFRRGGRVRDPQRARLEALRSKETMHNTEVLWATKSRLDTSVCTNSLCKLTILLISSSSIERQL